jgi:hypothetical protein
MHSLRLLPILASAALVGCASSPRSEAPPNAPRMGAMPDFVLAADAMLFAEADANHDRRTTSEELDAWTDAQWKILAGDKSAIGAVRFSEWTTSLFGPVDIASQFGNLSFDRNMDGQITREEFTAEMRRRLAFRDASADGVVERGELWVRLPRMPSMQRPPGGMPPGGMPPGGGRPPGM